MPTLEATERRGRVQPRLHCAKLEATLAQTLCGGAAPKSSVQTHGAEERPQASLREQRNLGVRPGLCLWVQKVSGGRGAQVRAHGWSVGRTGWPAARQAPEGKP